MAIGIAMTPRGEAGLVFAELGRVSGILDNQLYTGLIIAICPEVVLRPLRRRTAGGERRLRTGASAGEF